MSGVAYPGVGAGGEGAGGGESEKEDGGQSGNRDTYTGPGQATGKTPQN